MDRNMFVLLFIAFIINSSNGYQKDYCMDEPIGLAREDIVADEWFSATSADLIANEARMNRRGWTTTSRSASLQIKLYNPYFICGIGTRGSRDDDGSWVTSYNASFYSDSDCTKKVKTVSLHGNSDHDKIAVRTLDVGPIAKCVKIKATSSHGNTAMRVELYGWRKDENAVCTLKDKKYRCTCKPGTFIQRDRMSCLTKKNLETNFWVKVAANAYKMRKLVSYGSDEYEFMETGENETTWMYNSKDSLIANGISLNEKRLLDDVPVAYKDPSRGDDFLLFGKLNGTQKDNHLVMPVASVYHKGRQGRINIYPLVENFVYGEMRQVTKDNLKIAGNEDHCREGTHDCNKIPGTVCVTGDYPGTYTCLCHGGIAPVDGKCNMKKSQKHQVLVKESKDKYTLGTIISVGRKTVTIKADGKNVTFFNDEFRYYQPIDVLRCPSDEAIQKAKFVIVRDGDRYVPGKVVKTEIKGKSYDVKIATGRTFVKTKIDNIILDGTNHTLLDLVASCPERSVRVSGRYPGTYWCYCKGKIENDRCSDVIHGNIEYPNKRDSYYDGVVHYADYTVGLKEFRFNKTTAYVPGKHNLLFGNDDDYYKGNLGEEVLGQFGKSWQIRNCSTKGTIEGYSSESKDLYVMYGQYMNIPVRTQKILDMNGCKTFGHVCGKNAGICVTSKVPTAHLCQCYPGFQKVKGKHGEQCIDVNECNTRDVCGKQSTCQNSAGSYRCPCVPGYGHTKGSAINDDCRDINECNLGMCSPYSNCENTIGSYKCACKSGFLGDGKNCTDIDECKKDHKLCSGIKGAVCENKAGSYECKCTQSGFRVNDNKTQCIDIEECEKPGVCMADPNSRCVEVDGGGHTCPCKHGYRTVNGSCTDYHQCKEDPGLCGKDADCKEKVGGYQCLCHIGSGYKVNPKTKECVDIDECAVKPDLCSYLEGGSCKNSVGGVSCDCAIGHHNLPNPEYRGNSSIPREKCFEENECERASPVCTEPGKTVCEDLFPNNGRFQCTCADGYTDNEGRCDDVDECIKQTHNCDLDTTNCLNEPGGYQCNCKPGFGTVKSYRLKDGENKTGCFHPSAMRAGTSTLCSPLRCYILAVALVFVYGFLVAMAPRY